MQTIKYPSGTVLKAWTDGVPIEADVWTQAKNIANVPGVERIALMPDAHVGNGACVGSAVLTRDIVIPATVGVDIGCGMLVQKLNVTWKELEYAAKLPKIRHEIEHCVPVGRTDNGGANDRGAWCVIPDNVQALWNVLLQDRLFDIVDDRPELLFNRAINQLGTLGTGNHFIELQYDTSFEDNNRAYLNGWWDSPVYVMLHSGSRGVGNRIGTTYTRLARKEMEKWHIELPDPELAFLPVNDTLGLEYLTAAEWAQQYARLSRGLMLDGVLQALSTVLGKEYLVDEEAISAEHNYVSNERHFGKAGIVVRKGAIDASLGKLGIIPSSMGTPSFITSGLGNLDSLHTSSHGSGRVMSRTVAKRTISMSDHLNNMIGVEARQDIDVIDESPAAYKDIDAVMKAQVELTEPIKKLKQLVVVKG